MWAKILGGLVGVSLVIAGISIFARAPFLRNRVAFPIVLGIMLLGIVLLIFNVIKVGTRQTPKATPSWNNNGYQQTQPSWNNGYQQTQLVDISQGGAESDLEKMIRERENLYTAQNRPAQAPAQIVYTPPPQQLVPPSTQTWSKPTPSPKPPTQIVYTPPPQQSVTQAPSEQVKEPMFTTPWTKPVESVAPSAPVYTPPPQQGMPPETRPPTTDARETTSVFQLPWSTSTPPPPVVTQPISTAPPTQPTGVQMRPPPHVIPGQRTDPTTPGRGTGNPLEQHMAPREPLKRPKAKSPKRQKSPKGGRLPRLKGPIGSKLSQRQAQEMMDGHNRRRAEIGTTHLDTHMPIPSPPIPPLEWDAELATYAQQWTENMLSKRRMYHSKARLNGKWIGENIAYNMGTEATPEDKMKDWYDSEIPHYKYEDGSCAPGEQCGHATAMIWRNSTKMGCGLAKEGRTEYWSCNFSPGGNIVGRKPY